MQAPLNLDLNLITQSEGSTALLTSLQATFSETGIIQVPVIQNGARITEELADFHLKATIKERGEFDQDPPIALITDFDWNPLTFQYDAEINWNIDAVLELLGIDSEPIDITGLEASDLITTASDHGLVAGDRVYFPALTGGAGLTEGYGNWYYVIASGLTNDDLKVSATLGGSAVNFTTDITSGSTIRKAPADVSSAELGLGLSWRRSSGDAWKVADNSVDLDLNNSYPREADGTPLSAGTSAADAFVAARALLYDRDQSLTQSNLIQLLENGQFIASALTGGAAGALDNIVTASGAVTTGRIVFACVSSQLSAWKLISGTTAEDATAGIVRPDDYDGSTNARIWSRISGTAAGAALLFAANAAAQVALLRTSLPAEIGIACSDEIASITTGTAKVTFRMPYAMVVTSVIASVKTAPTGSTIIIDINEAGTTILSTKLSIDISEKTSTTAATPAVISDANLAADAEITIDFDQVGSTIPGTAVKVWLIGTRAV